MLGANINCSLAFQTPILVFNMQRFQSSMSRMLTIQSLYIPSKYWLLSLALALHRLTAVCLRIHRHRCNVIVLFSTN